jgi:deoxyguanosine kinase
MKTYDYISAKLTRLVRQPDILIHLDASVETLLDRLARRGRSYEAAFDADFLTRLRRANAKITPPDNCKSIRLDADALDFRKTDDTTEILRQVRRALDE